MVQRGFRPENASGQVVEEPVRFAWLRSEADGSIVDIVNETKLWDGETETLLVGSDTTVGVSDDDSTVVSEPSDINFGSNLDVTDDGDGTVTVTGTASGTDVEVQDDGATVETALALLDLQNALDANSATTGEVEVGVDESAISHDNLSGISPSDHHARPGAGNALTEDGSGNFDVDESDISHDNLADVSSGDHHTRPSAGTGLSEDGSQNFDVQDEYVEDVVAALLSASGNISITYDDAGDNLVVDTSALNQEEVEDAVSALLSAGNGVSLTYDDGNDDLTVAVADPLTGTQIGTSSNREDAYFDAADANSFSTEEIDISTLTSGASHKIWDAVVDGDEGVGTAVQQTEGVSGSDTVILDFSSENSVNPRAFVAFVAGIQDGDVATRFVSLVAGIPTATASETVLVENNSPDARNFSAPGSQDLQLNMASNTYSVETFGIALRVE